MPNSIPDDKEGLLRTLAQLYALEGKTTEVQLLAESSAEIVQTDYDNWDGGQYTYALFLRVPTVLYVRLRPNLEEFVKDLKSRITPLLSGYSNEWIDKIEVTPVIENDENWRTNALKWIRTQSGGSGGDQPSGGYDFFISHASEDKDAVVRPLAERLRFTGFRVWYDEFTLTVGHSLRASIDSGLANSRYGIVVLSKNFFAKNWTGYELNGLVARQNVGEKVILPIWHEITRAEVAQHSPPLADMLALDASKLSLETIVETLKNLHAPRRR